MTECALAVAQCAETTLLSRLPYRERWSVPKLLNRPRYAAAVEARLRKELPGVAVHVNNATGRVLFESLSNKGRLPSAWAVLQESLGEEPMQKTIFLERQAKQKTSGKPRKLVTKLVIGGSKLLLILSNRLLWGAVALSPIATPIAVLSIAGTVITGYDFLRALVRTVTGQSGITTGTLIGAATLSSLMLRENVTALIVLWLLNLGEYLEILTLRRTRKAIRHLLSTEDDEVWLLTGGSEVSIRVSAVKPGDLVLVRAGRRIPVDGIVEAGEAFVNQAPITGESMPVMRRFEDPVYAGTVIVSGSVKVRVTGVGSDTVVGRLIQRVEEAQTLRPRIQTVGDAFAKRVVPASFAAALLVFLVTRDPRRALTMMLVACPCAAGLATPTAVSASIGNGARRGILIKGGTHLEAMAEVDTVCFDKTGTLTESHPAVRQVVSLHEEYSEERVLSLAAQVERHSQHPLGLAIIESARQQNLVSPLGHEDDDFEILSGRGVRTWNAAEEILAGNARLLAENGIELPEVAQHWIEHLAEQAVTTIFVVHQHQLIGIVTVAAAVRPEAASSIARLSDAGITRIVMLTGDGEGVAKAVASAVGVKEWQSGLLPQDKFQAIQALRGAGRKVAMVGDGINDAPALALADVGIAMGTGGSDVAIETSDVALAADDLQGVGSVIDLSRRTMSVIRQNYGLALGTNSIGLYLAAVGSINPIIAAVLHNLSTILVIANSTRLIRFDPTGDRSGAERFHYRPGSPLRSGQEYEAECGSACGGTSRTTQAKHSKFKEHAA